MALGFEGSAGKLKGKYEEPEKKLDVLIKKPSDNHSDSDDKKKGNEDKEEKEV